MVQKVFVMFLSVTEMCKHMKHLFSTESCLKGKHKRISLTETDMADNSSLMWRVCLYYFDWRVFLFAEMMVTQQSLCLLPLSLLSTSEQCWSFSAFICLRITDIGIKVYLFNELTYNWHFWLVLWSMVAYSNVIILSTILWLQTTTKRYCMNFCLFINRKVFNNTYSFGSTKQSSQMWLSLALGENDRERQFICEIYQHGVTGISSSDCALKSLK